MAPSNDPYAKRKLNSIPAPIELDSDSDFNPGPYIPESVKKKRGTNKGKERPNKRQRTDNGSKRFSNGSVTRRRHEAPHAVNPLKKYFEDFLDLESASEDEDDDPADDPFIDSEENSISSTSTPQVSASLPVATPLQPRAAVTPQPPPVVDDSATEDDSDPDPAPVPLSSCALAKSIKPGVDDSATEEDSEDSGDSPPNSTRPLVAHPRPSDDDSATEDDSEPEEDLKPANNPRPGFPLAPGQRFASSLLLDRKLGIKIPGAINAYLRDYQRKGVEFLWRQYNRGQGGLLGDDMGLPSVSFIIRVSHTHKNADQLLMSRLGKTIQVIAFLSAIMAKTGLPSDMERRKKYVSRLQDSEEWKKHRKLPKANEKWPTCLIIAPSTVVHNWEREFETWGYFEVGLYFGGTKDREVVLNDFKLGRSDVVITSFDLARRDIELLDDLPWSCIIVDEVHRVKNESSKITVAYHQFNCLRRFGLTGTAIQNSYKELWTILDWTNPGQVGTSRQWNGYVVKPLTMGQSTSSNELQRAQALIVAQILRDKLLPEFFLRRTKDIIKGQLPKKTDEVVFCPLTAVQVMAYKRLLGMEAMQNLLKRDEPCTCGSRKPRKTCCHPFVAGDVFRFMSVLIKLSNHLALILPGPTDTAGQIVRNRQLARIAFPHGDVPKYGTAMLEPQFCGKWGILEVLLKEWRRDATNKVLVFTKSVKLLEMLEFHLSNKGFSFLKLDGSTKQSDRMPMIDQFNKDPAVYVFLISTLAGGTGLNLTGANKVVIFDPNWNPAHDLQAMDRAFRFGQTRDVSVYRLLGAGSVEELIYARQIYKQQQMAIGYDASVQTRYFEGVQGDNSKQGELFGINNIFKLHEDKLATKMAIEKANLAELDWALANLNSSKGRKNKPNKEIIEAESKVTKSEDISMKGLGALLFDDDAPKLSQEEDGIHNILNTIGVQYSHKNDDVLLPSKIEMERIQQSLLKQKVKQMRAAKGKGKGKGSSSKEATPEVKPAWPPKRKHHSVPTLTPQQQLATRYQALVCLGYVSSLDGAPAFAKEFAQKPVTERNKIIQRLDDWARENPDLLDSD